MEEFIDLTTSKYEIGMSRKGCPVKADSAPLRHYFLKSGSGSSTGHLQLHIRCPKTHLGSTKPANGPAVFFKAPPSLWLSF